MSNNFFKQFSPYILALTVFLTITFVYFYPVLEGKKLKQHDIKMFKGMSKEIADFRASTGEEALWTNSMFGGMPAWQISVRYRANLMRYVDKVITLGLPYPTNYVFLYFLGFFVLMLVMRINPWVSLAGAIAFALSSYFFIILGAGHTSKAHAIGYMAPVMAGIILTFNGKYLWGGLLTAIALALEIYSGHLQITYYLLILVVVYGVFQVVEMLQSKNYLHFGKASGILIAAALLAVLTHSTNLWATYDYGKDTMRGKPELTKELKVKSSGLDKDYITAWSYGVAETWSFLIPNVKGGASGLLGNRPELKNADPGYRKAIAQQGSAYWGEQPGTSGPVYVGVIVMFLFILGLFIVNNKLKWALLAATILSIMLGWGKNFMPLTDFFIDYVPGYAKFRAVSMILVIAELTIPILAFMGLHKIFTETEEVKKKIKAFYISLAATAGIIILFYLMPTAFFNFTNSYEDSQFSQMLQGENAVQISAFISSLEDVRIAIFKNDALRSLSFLLAGGLLIYLLLMNKIGKTLFISVLSLLILVDMFGVDKRYLNNEKKGAKFEMWESKRLAKTPFAPSKADNIILQDRSEDYRVLDLTKSTFNDASTSYFHKSIGGYHGAKLQRYQDLIENNISPEISNLFKGLKSGTGFSEINNLLKNQQVLGMLNTKYIIYSPDASPLINPAAFGNAWIVRNHKFVESPDAEIAGLKDNDLRTTAIIDKKFEDNVSTDYSFDSTASITLKSYKPNNLVYSFSSTKNQMVVFSEIYYDKGWNAYIDGEESPYFRADYVLRAMSVPAGKHEIEFRFEPLVWAVGERISFASSLILILLLLFAFYREVRTCRHKRLSS
ncbi:MAG: YfhO family protein [Chlorobi bacterium]|nr:YfhO family protein [Chlorobiota bacterium]